MRSTLAKKNLRSSLKKLRNKQSNERNKRQNLFSKPKYGIMIKLIGSGHCSTKNERLSPAKKPNILDICLQAFS